MLAGARIFSKLDANMGLWQIPLAEESAKYTTFITPFGRYHFQRLPFGINSAPEHFQRVMAEVIDGLDGVVCHIMTCWCGEKTKNSTTLVSMPC